LSAAIQKLSAKEVSQLDSLDKAFDMLLLPLASISTEIIILIDAMDEADPIEQQQPGYKGYVRAYGNRALALVISHLAKKLPPSVRFIFTSRPDAVCGGIRAVMELAFPDVTFVAPWQLRGSTAAAAAGGGRVLVYDTVVKECKLSMPPLSAAPDLEALYSAYRCVFDRHVLSVDAASLLQVLMAAQEPPSSSLLQQVRLSHHLASLPGWGTLFYEADHRIYLLHKSLSDWLLDGDKSGHHRVEPKLGHKLLGLAGEEYCHAELGLRSGGAEAKGRWNRYALRHTLTHLCLAGDGTAAAPVAAGPEGRPAAGPSLGKDLDVPAHLERLLLNIGFWQHAYAAGLGPDVFHDLLKHCTMGDVAKDVARWLRTCSAFMAKYPE
jgi:hypothetical protein